MQVATSVGTGCHSGAEHPQDLVKRLASQFAVRPRATTHRVQILLARLLRRHAGDDLLSKNVEGGVGNFHSVQLLLFHSADQSQALHQLVTRQRKQTPLGDHTQRMPRTPHPLEKFRNAARRSDLADQVDETDVDPHLQRGRGDDRFQLSRLQPLFG